MCWKYHETVKEHITLIAVIMMVMIVVPAWLLVRRFRPNMSGLGSGSTPEPFARLLFAEILLNDQKAADEGWSRSAVYRLLKSDIDRAREMFLLRFPASEQAFYSTLVSVLARGEEGRLGSDYPHPRPHVEKGP